MDPPRRPPRRPLITFTVAEVLPEFMALLRMTWFGPDGRPHHVEEFAVYEGPPGEKVVEASAHQAMLQGFDLHIVSEYEPAVFNLPGC